MSANDNGNYDGNHNGDHDVDMDEYDDEHNNEYDVDDENDYLNCESLYEYIYKLCDLYRFEICELSRENGYPLNIDNNKWFLKSSLMKLVQIPSDSKMFETLSLHFSKTNINAQNINYQNKFQNKDLYKHIMYFYLNIQINNNECIHVRIYSKESNNTVQAILYKGINDKLRQF